MRRRLNNLSTLKRRNNYYKFCSIYSSIQVGNEENEKIYLNADYQKKSFWHDIPLKSKENEAFNFIIEIPCKSRIILEMNKNEEYNPLLRKINKKSTSSNLPINIRDYSKDPICNYGFFPQTYSTKEKLFRGSYKGDNDPIDVIEIGGPFESKAGDVMKVGIIGSFCLIDQGEMDWKIVVSNINTTPNSNQTEEIKYIMHWFKIFKTFYGKKENTILDNDKFFSKDETLKVIEESHQDYLKSDFYKSYLKNQKI